MKIDDLLNNLEALEITDLTTAQRTRLVTLSKKFIKTSKSKPDDGIEVAPESVGDMLGAIAELLKVESADDRQAALKSLLHIILRCANQ